MNARYVTTPKYVRAADLGAVTAIVNYRTGDVNTLVGPAARWWADVAATSDPYTLSALDSGAAGTLVRQLGAAGLVVPTQRPRPWLPPVAAPPWQPSWGSQEVAAGYVAPDRVSHGATVRAGVALAVVLGVAVGKSRMARVIRLLESAARPAAIAATAEEVREAAHAVRRAGLLAPCRVACAEESAAVALMLAASRRRVTWCHGVTADPVRLHAWVETDDGQAPAEPPSNGRLTTLCTIPARTHGK